jgi:predicted 3-demethylubiquinone-9 3-methyltransferase (glyoxalase superfamily)
VVSCETQKEIDHYWDRLSEGGLEVQCGWLTDKFGLSWQIVPAKLSELIRHPKAMHAMMAMKKLVIAELEAAAQP